VTTKKPTRRYQRYPKELRALAIERLKNCRNVTALALELEIDRGSLYKWRERMQGKEETPTDSMPRTQQQEIDQLKRLLAEKTLEVDFFKGALQKVAARRQNNSEPGGKASTPKSGS
jgi:transposase-like protein